MKLSDRIKKKKKGFDEPADVPGKERKLPEVPRAEQDLAEAAMERLYLRLSTEKVPAFETPVAERVFYTNLIQSCIEDCTDEKNFRLSQKARQKVRKRLADLVVGFGPIQKLLDDEDVAEIMINGPHMVYVERKGKLILTDIDLGSDEQAMFIVQKILVPIDRRCDRSNPMVDARLLDGSRVNIVIPPLALNGPTVTIRKFSKDPLRVSDLVGFGSLTQDMADFLRICVRARLNIVVSGGTGSGKTTTLNALSSFIPGDERIVTIEDAAELQLQQDHVVGLETRPANIEGQGEVTIRDLVRNSLRMRPDRIIIGECRGGETLDMLQAMNTGHDGSLTTGHSNSPTDMVRRLETMVMMAGMALPLRNIREQIAGAVHLIVQQNRLQDGSRRITHITEVRGLNPDGTVKLVNIYEWVQQGLDENRKVLGYHEACGNIPAFLLQLRDECPDMPGNILGPDIDVEAAIEAAEALEAEDAAAALKKARERAARDGRDWSEEIELPEVLKDKPPFSWKSCFEHEEEKPAKVEFVVPEVKRGLGLRARRLRNKVLDKKDLDTEFRARVTRMLMDRLNLALQFEHVDLTSKSKEEERRILGEMLRHALNEIVHESQLRLSGAAREDLLEETLKDVAGFGPIQELLDDDTVSEVMVNGPNQVYVEKSGKLILSKVTFKDDAHVRYVIERIVSPIGRRCDASSPLVDARLPDGSRVNAVIPPIALKGSSLTIRKFSESAISMADLVEWKTLTPGMSRFLDASVYARLNIIVSGGTGSGKTTTLNAISAFIPGDERIVTIEDAAELQLQQDHVVGLETRPPNIEGSGEVTIRDLVKNSLRMRPERVIIGECRAGEALDMLQAMNTGHDGSLTTGHANTPRDMVSRLEVMVMMAGLDLPGKNIREQIASAVDLIVQQNRLRDGSRKITAISEVVRVVGEQVEVRDIFEFVQEGVDEYGKVIGYHRPTGYIPTFAGKLATSGFSLDDDIFGEGTSFTAILEERERTEKEEADRALAIQLERAKAEETELPAELLKKLEGLPPFSWKDTELPVPVEAPEPEGPAARRKRRLSRSRSSSSEVDMEAVRVQLFDIVVDMLGEHERRTGSSFSDELLEVQQAALECFRMMAKEENLRLPETVGRKLAREIAYEIAGFGPIQKLLDQKDVSEVMVNGPKQIYVEKGGKLTLSEVTFRDDQHVQQIINKIVMPLGRRCDVSSPIVDARLPDGSRVNAIIPPVALSGPSITIRKFAKNPITVDRLIEFGTLTKEMALFLEACVHLRLNIVISGGTGSGKTTTLNAISGFIPSDERIVTIEDAAELQLAQDHVVGLETRPANAEGVGAVTIRDLVKNSLRMRPERIIVGECRAGETLDMLQAMNTGHDGSLTTGHANTPGDMIARIETMVMMAGMNLPQKSIRETIASAVDIVVQQSRLHDGQRKITHITEIAGMDGEEVDTRDIFVWQQHGHDDDGKILGALLPTGKIPSFLHRFPSEGIELPEGLFGDGLLMEDLYRKSREEARLRGDL